MKLEYKTKKELKPYKEIANDAFKNIQSLLKNYNCFYRLVGSAKRNLVLYNPKSNNEFDLDYQIVFRDCQNGQKSDDLISIKREFREELDKYFTNNGYENGEDSTTSITYKKIINGKIDHSFDFVLLSPTKNDGYSVFKYENEEKTIMQLAELKDSNNFNQKYKSIRKKEWAVLRDKYKAIKGNNHDKNKKSFDLLIECVNNITNNI